MFLIPLIAYALPTKTAEIAQAPKIAPEVVYSKGLVISRISEVSLAYGLNRGQSEAIVRVIACESQFRPDAVGDGGSSYGLAQIHLPSHPGITKEQAMDPEFAIKYIVSNFAAGHSSMWSCAKKLGIS